MITITPSHQYSSRNLDALLEEGDTLVLTPNMAGTINLTGAITSGGIKFPDATQHDDGSLQFCFLNNTSAELTLKNGADATLQYTLQPGQIASFMLSVGGSVGGTWYLLSEPLVSTSQYHATCRVAIPESIRYIPAGNIVGITYTAANNGVLPAMDGYRNTGTSISFEIAGSDVTLTDAGKFSSAFVGLSVEIHGSTTPGNDGTFTITAATADSITYTNASGATEAGVSTTQWIAGGVVLVDGDRILIIDGTSTYGFGGIWEVTSVGAVDAPFVLTRIHTLDLPSDAQWGALVSVVEGITYGGTTWRIGVVGVDLECIWYPENLLAVQYDHGSGTFNLIQRQNSDTDSSLILGVSAHDNTIIGKKHRISGSAEHNLIAGNQHILSVNMCVVAGGQNSATEGTDYSAIFGHSNTLNGGSGFAGVFGEGHLLQQGSSYCLVAGLSHVVQAGGAYNLVAGNDHTVNGSANAVVGNGNSVGTGGANNVVGGYQNTDPIGSCANNAVFGYQNFLTHASTGNGTSNCIMAGAANKLGGGTSYDAVFGNANKVYGGTSGALISGSNNIVGASTGALVAGDSNTVVNGSAYSAVIGQSHSLDGGCSNNLVAGSSHSAASGTQYNLIVGYGHTLVSGIQSSAITGNTNKVYSGYGTLVAGANHMVNNPTNSVVFGYSNSITNLYTAIINGGGNKVGSWNFGTSISFSKTGSDVTLTDAGKFNESYVGLTIEVVGSTTSGNNGTFIITAATANSVTYVNASGAVEAGVAGTKWAVSLSTITYSILTGSSNNWPESITNSLLSTSSFFVDGGTINTMGVDFSMSGSILAGANHTRASSGSTFINSVAVGVGIRIRNTINGSAIFGSGHDLSGAVNESIVAGSYLTVPSNDSLQSCAIFGQGHTLNNCDYTLVSGNAHSVTSTGAIAFSDIAGYSHDFSGSVSYGAVFGANFTSANGATSSYDFWAGSAHNAAGNTSYCAVFGSTHTVRNGINYVLVAGYNNLVETSADYSIVAGQGHTANSGSSHAAVFGQSNTVTSGSTHMLLSGKSNTATSGVYFGLVVGEGNTINNSSNHSAIIGKDCTTTNGSLGSLVTGYKAKAATHKMMHVHAGGHPESETGIAGEGQLVDRIPHSNTTLDATPVSLYPDGYTASPLNEWSTVSGHAFVLVTYVIAKCTTGDSAGGVRSWRIITTLNNVSGTLSIIGTPITEDLHSTAVVGGHEVDWEIVPEVSGNTFRFQATGHADDVVRWQAFSQGPEIGIA